MPAVAAAAAAAVTWVSSAAASAAALVATSLSVYTGISIGAAISITNLAGTLALNALGSFAINAIMAPRANTAGSPISFKADPSSPIRGVMGRFGTGGTQNHMRVWGKNNLFISYSVILSLGPIQGIDSFTARGIPVQFTGAQGQAANVEPFKDKMWMTYKMGLPTDGALGPPVGIPDGHVNLMTEWTPNHRTSGYAGAFWTMKNNSKRASYEGGVPLPNWVVNGMKLYDPRKDSTQTSIGGSGPHRWDDWRTWEFSKNAKVHALNWCLGHHKHLPDGVVDRSILLAGVGADISAIDLPTFVAGANVSDANNWTISGEWSTQDDKWQVLTSMLQAGSAVPVHVGSKIGIMVNAPRVAVANITNDDIVGNMNIKVMASRRDRFNTIYPRYICEDQKWEYATAGAVTSTVYTDQDNGEERSKEMTYNYVDKSLQAAQLAGYDLANTRESLKVSFASKPYLLGVKPGDAVTVTSAEHGLAGQKFLVLARPIDLMEGGIAFELRSETDSKHAFAMGQTDQPAPSPSLTAVDTQPFPPEADEWTVIPRPADPGGTQQPGIIVVGEVPDGIGSMTIEVGPSDIGPWRQVYSGPPTSEAIPVEGLSPGEEYYVNITYISIKGFPSVPRVFGPVTAPQLIANSSITFPDGTVPIWSYPTASDLPVTAEEGQQMAFVEDEQKLYTWNPVAGVWSKSVDGADIDPGTLGNLAFADGIQAPGLGSVLPALPDVNWPNGSIFVRTTDGLAYTNRDGVWSASVTEGQVEGVSADKIQGFIQSGQIDSIAANKVSGQIVETQIAANAVTTGKISANAIVSDKIAANAVTVNKLSVLPFNMNPDINFDDPTYWNAPGTSADGWRLQEANPGGAGVPGRFAILAESWGVGSAQKHVYTPVRYGLTAGKVYRFRAAGNNVSNQNMYIEVNFMTAGGVYISNAALVWPANSGISWRELVATAPANAAGYRFVFYNLSGTPLTGIQLLGNIDLVEAASANMIVDGAIIADKLAANSVVAGKIAAGAVTTDKLDALAVTAGKIAAGAITATAIATDAVTAEKVLAGSITADKIATNAVTADKIVAGAVTATKINVTDLAAINADLGVVTAGRVQNSAGTTFFDLTNARSQYRRGGYDLRMGTIGTGVVMWYGPVSTVVGEETRTNGVWSFGDDGKVYYGSAELPPGGSSGGGLIAGPDIISGTLGTIGVTWVTWGSVTFANMPTGGKVRLHPDVSGLGITLTSGSSFQGEWRVTQNSFVIASGAFSATSGGGDADISLAYSSPPLTPAQTGTTTLVFQVRRASGTNDISNGASSAFYVEWFAGG